jgi:phosphoglucosamine mutase
MPAHGKQCCLPLAIWTQGLEVLPQKLVNVRLSQMQDPYKHDVLSVFDAAKRPVKDADAFLFASRALNLRIRVMAESDDEIECDNGK